MAGTIGTNGEDIRRDDYNRPQESAIRSLAGDVARACGISIEEALDAINKAVMADTLSAEERLNDMIKELDRDNRRLRGLNGRLKGEIRGKDRSIRNYKEQLAAMIDHKPKFRNKNHQGGRRR